MKTETQIAKELINEIGKLEERFKVTFKEAQENLIFGGLKLTGEIHKATCQRFLEFLEDIQLNKKGDYITLEKGTPQNQEKGCENVFDNPIDDLFGLVCGEIDEEGNLVLCPTCQEKSKGGIIKNE